MVINKTVFWVLMMSVLWVGCRIRPTHEDHGRVVLYYQDMPIVVTGLIRDAHYDERQGEPFLVLPLEDIDAESIAELVSDFNEILVSIYLGGEFYGEVLLTNVGATTTLVLPYPHEGRERYWGAVRKSVIKIRGIPKP